MIIEQQSAGFVVFRVHKGRREYLLLQHTHGYHWDFPKGKIEPGESKEEAAIRELQEETGIDIRKSGSVYPDFELVTEYVFPKNDGSIIHKTVYFFLASTTDMYPVVSHEHTDFGWFEYPEALAKITYDTARTILKQAHEFLLINQR